MLNSLDEVDPELRQHVRRSSAFRSRNRSCSPASPWTRCSTPVSVATTFRSKLAELGIIFCSFSEAVQEHPELVQKYPRLGRALHGQLLRDAQLGGLQRRQLRLTSRRACAARWSCRTYFRINAPSTGQFERTLIVADEGAYVSYLEGCTAPMRDENQLHAAVVELVALDDATIKYSTVQNWYPGDKDGKGGIYNFVTKRGSVPRAALEDHVDAGRDRLGDHVEVPELHPAGRRLDRRVLLGGARRTTASRPTPARR